MRPLPPYDFDLSVRNPSHYPVPTNTWKHGTLWFTVRWQGEPYGVRFDNQGSLAHPTVGMTIFGRRKISKTLAEEILQELSYRFEWNVD